MAKHKISSNGVEYELNFNSYAIMMIMKKHNNDLSNLADTQAAFDMIKFGLSDNGRNDISDPEVYDFIDGLEGGALGDDIKKISKWIFEAFKIPEALEAKKKEEVLTEV